jgi:hypothetical protein
MVFVDFMRVFTTYMQNRIKGAPAILIDYWRVKRVKKICRGAQIQLPRSSV